MTIVMPARPATSGRWRVAGIVGPDGARAALGPLASLDVAVEHGVITLIEAIDDGPGDVSPWLVVVPLLVNAHDHGRGNGHVLAGIPDGPLEEWIASLRDHPPTTQAALVGDGCALMLASGIGASVICVNPQGPDTTAEVVAAARAAQRLGVRAAIVYPFADAMDDLDGRTRDAGGWSAADVATRLDAVEAIAAEHGSTLIEIQLGPVGPQWVSESTLAAIGAHARRAGRRVHMHLLESPTQRAWADRTYPDGVVDLLRRTDLLGPHVCFAHGTQLRPAELSELAASGCVLSLNASSNLRLSSGFAPVAAARAAEVHVGAGLDGLALGDDADYWNELRLLRGIGQAQSGERVDAATLLDELLLGGRQALGGCAPAPVVTGSVADFVVLDLTPYRHLVEDASWSLADVVLAAGRPERIREVWVGGSAVLTRGMP
jgi:cytosine/adenosine deaminase-related metal-dependent hydrolase